MSIPPMPRKGSPEAEALLKGYGLFPAHRISLVGVVGHTLTLKPQQRRNGAYKASMLDKDDALITEYLGSDYTGNWSHDYHKLSTALLNTGHAIDVVECLDTEIIRVSVGKHGVSLTGKGETLSYAMFEATVSFIKFLQKIGHGTQVTRSKSNMPLQAAIQWMIEGKPVRRAEWMEGVMIRLELGSMPLNAQQINGCLLGVPIKHYEQTTGNTFSEARFIRYIENDDGLSAGHWECDAMSALATDWEIADV